MFNLTTPTLKATRALFTENVSSNEVYLSLFVIYVTLSYFFYDRFWCKRGGSVSLEEVKRENANLNLARENGILKNYAFSKVKVTKLLIHPIKSCHGTSVLEAEYTEEGLEHDRKLAIINANTHKVITAREQPRMVLIYPQVIVDDQDPFGGRIHISFPVDSGCEPFAIPLQPTNEILQTWRRSVTASYCLAFGLTVHRRLEDVELWGRSDIDGFICQSLKPEDRDAPTRILSEFLGKGVFLVLKGPRPRPCPPTHEFPSLRASALYQDGYPLLVASEESLLDVQTQLRSEVGNQGVAYRWGTDNLVIERFRPNIVLAGASVPWAEDAWETIRIGENASTITLVSKCTRCLLPNVDPETGERDKAVPYKVLMKFRTGRNPMRLSKPCFGCNGVPNGRGRIRVGDSVTVVKSIEH